MGKGKTIVDPVDRRQYLRMKTSVPVEFTIVRLQGDLPGFDWEKGHTCNVSRSGLCLESTRLRESTIIYLSRENIYLELKIYLPGILEPIKAVGEVAWHQEKKGEPGQFIIGLKYRSIIPSHLTKVLSHARRKKHDKRKGSMSSVMLGITFIMYLFDCILNNSVRLSSE